MFCGSGGDRGGFHSSSDQQTESSWRKNMGASSHRKRLSRRKRSVVGLLALVASAIFLLPASQASAAKVTQENACINNLVATQASKIPVTTEATASPNPVLEPGDAVTLS